MLGLLQRGAIEFRGGIVADLGGIRKTNRCQGAPDIGLHIILRHPLTEGIHGRQQELSLQMVLLRRLTVPEQRLTVVLWHAMTVVIDQTDVVRRLWMVGLSRFAIPKQRLVIVLFDAAPHGV